MKKMLLTLLCVFLVSGTYAQLDSYDLLLYLDFEDEAELTLNDQGLTANEVQYTAEYSMDAKIGSGAASFDGTQYIIFDPEEDWNLATTSYTWAAWVSTASVGGTVCAWAPYSGTPAFENGGEDENDPHMAGVHSLFWGLEDGSTPVFDVGWVGLTIGETELNDEAWHHVAVTVDNENNIQQLYVNGVAEGEFPGDWDVPAILQEVYDDPEAPGEPDITTFRMKIGYSTSGWPWSELLDGQVPYFTGVMDEFRMYSGALTADDIQELFEITEITSRQEQSLKNPTDFVVHPNPATDHIRIFSELPVRSLSIFNSLGQEVMRAQDVRNRSVIDISVLGSGLYFIKSGDSMQKLLVD